MKKIKMFRVGSSYRLSVRENGKEIDGMPIHWKDEAEGRKILEEKYGITPKTSGGQANAR